MTKKISKIKTMADLEHNDCRWPIGDPRHADFHFCGAKQALGRPYCQHHWDLSYMPKGSRTQGGQQPNVAFAFPMKRAA